MDNKFDSTYSIVNTILDRLGGTATNYDSTYSICLRILDLVEQGGGGSEFDPVAARAAVTLDATELFNKAIGGGALTIDFKAKLLEAIELNKILYICDKTNGAISVIITFIDKSNNDYINFTASDGTVKYQLHLDLTTDFVTIKQEKIGDPFNKYDNSVGNSIFDLTVDSTNEQIQTAITNSKGNVVVPNTGDVFSVVDEAGISDSGIVMSKTSTPNTIDIIILSNNLVDVYSVQHHIKFNYNDRIGLDSLSVANAEHIVIDPKLLDHEKLTALYADVARKQDTLVSGQNIKTINNKSILGEGNITIESGGLSVEVIDNLNSTAVDDALSANQGKVLNDTKADKSEISDMLTKTEASTTYQPVGDYALKSELTPLVNKSEIADMETKTHAAETYQPIGDYLNPEAISDMLTKTVAKDTYQPKGNYLTEIPAEYVTDSELNAKDYATNTALKGKADKSEISDMLTKTEASTTYQPKGDYQPVGDYATKSDLDTKQNTLISGSNIKTINGTTILGEGDINIEAGTTVTVEDNLTSTSTTNALSANQGKVLNDTKADKSELTPLLTKTEAAETYQPIGNYAKADDISDMLTKTEATDTYQPKGNYLTEVPAEYVTDSELNAKDYATNTALSGKADKSEISDMLTKTEAKNTYQPKGDYQPVGDYVTNEVLNSKNYANKDDLNTKANKSEIADMLTKTEAKDTYQLIGDYATNTALKGKADKSEISDMLTKTIAAETYQPIGNYQEAGNYATVEQLDTKASKSAIADMETKTHATETYQPIGQYATKSELAGKQDILVGTEIEGQNIKTINGTTILGTGDLKIEAGGGVGKATAEGGEIFNDYVNNKATKKNAHAEGEYTQATWVASHAEGDHTESKGLGSHAEGSWTHATDVGAHAEGNATWARKSNSHAEGDHTLALGWSSHAEGDHTIAANWGQHASGQYNTDEVSPSPIAFNAEKTLFVIGNGTSNEAKSDAFKMLGNGTTWIAGIGDFNGTNPTPENSLQSVIKNAGGGGSSVTVEDNLTSTSTTNALSANQGKVLKDLIDAQATEIQALKDAIGILTAQLDKINGETI